MKDKIRKQSRLRMTVQAISFAFHNGYVIGWAKTGLYTGENKKFCVPGLNCYSCPGAIGSCPIGSLQAVLDSGEYKFSLYVIGIIGAIGIFLGRLVCGWLCPFGWVQDLVYKIPLLKKEKNLPGHKYLRYIKYIVLVLFVILLPMLVLKGGAGQPWFCEWICPSGTLLGGIPQVLIKANLREAIGFRFLFKMSVLIALLVLSVKFARPFCKYLCPLGALYGFCNPVSTYRLKVNKESCTECGACRNVCPMDISAWKDPNSVECIRCGKCMAACPTGSVTSTWKMLLDGKTGLSGKETAEQENLKTVSQDPTLLTDTAGNSLTAGQKIAAMMINFLVAAFGILLAGLRLFTQIQCADGLSLDALFPVISGCVAQIMVYYLMIELSLRIRKSLRVKGLDEEIRDLARRTLVWALILRIGVSAVSYFLYAYTQCGTAGEVLVYILELLVYFRRSELIPVITALVSWLILRDWK